MESVKERRGWGGYTTRDIARCRLTARRVALVYNWWSEREAVLVQAFETMPERFVRGVPKPSALPAEVWINKPKTADGSTDELHIKF